MLVLSITEVESETPTDQRSDVLVQGLVKIWCNGTVHLERRWSNTTLLDASERAGGGRRSAGVVAGLESILILKDREVCYAFIFDSFS